MFTYVFSSSRGFLVILVSPSLFLKWFLGVALWLKANPLCHFGQHLRVILARFFKDILVGIASGGMGMSILVIGFCTLHFPAAVCKVLSFKGCRCWFLWLASMAECAVFSDLSGLADELDAQKDIRERLRRVGRVVVDRPGEGEAEKPGDVCLKTMENVRYNAQALRPCVARLSKHHDKIICINALNVELRECFRKSGLVPTVKVLSDQAWSVRYLMTVLKGLMYRSKPPKETWIYLVYILGEYFR